MPGTTADISQFCEFGGYEWVKFCSTTIFIPEDWIVLGKYIRRSINVEPAMTAKILTQMEEVVHHSTYRPLTPNDPANPVK